MALQSEVSIGLKKESTYGTAVTVDRFLEVLPDPSLGYEFKSITSKGLRVGNTGVSLLSRRVRTTSEGSGDIEFELVTRGMGTLFEALFGTGASTLVSGSTYQQNFTLGALPSLTIQEGLVLGDSSGTRDPQTFKGCVCSGFEVDVSNGEFAKVKTSWDIRAFDSAVAYASPSYAVASGYHWGIAGITVGGSPTAPTTTALASGGTAVTNVRAFNVKVDHGLSSAFHMGNSGLKDKPEAGFRTITGTIEMEHDSTTMRTAYVNDTTMPIVLTLTSADSLSSGTATLQFYIPGAKLLGPLPTSNGGQVPSVTYNFEALYDGTNAAIQACFRTADTAL